MSIFSAAKYDMRHARWYWRDTSVRARLLCYAHFGE